MAPLTRYTYKSSCVRSAKARKIVVEPMPTIYVPCLHWMCDATRALRAHQVEHTAVIMETPFSYGELLTELFHKRETFILVEHDIIPWPGALEKLAICEKDYCGYHYVIGSGMGGSLGCTKFGKEMLERLPDLVDFSNVEWKGLDGVVNEQLTRHLGESYEMFHIHGPEVAHMHQYFP